MKRVLLLVGILVIAVIGIGILTEEPDPIIDDSPAVPSIPDEEPEETTDPEPADEPLTPRIASWLAKKDELIESGEPLGEYYEKDGAYFREYANGVVVSAPNGVDVRFDDEYTDTSSGVASREFTIEEGDGRIFLLKSLTS